MSSTQPMPSARRRRITGMASDLAPPPPSQTGSSQLAASAEVPAISIDSPESRGESSGGIEGRSTRGARRDRTSDACSQPERRPAADYGSTRLVNFRIPVDLHDRFRALVREAEVRHPKLRRPSLTELMIALLEEGPQTASEVAELIRRKRAAEHDTEGYA